MISPFLEREWRKQYLQEVKKILEDSAVEYNLEQLREKNREQKSTIMELNVVGDDYAVWRYSFERLLPILKYFAFWFKNDSSKGDRPDSFDPEQYPRYSSSELFDFLSGLTNYGKYRIANRFPGDDGTFQGLWDALFSNDKKKFIAIIDDNSNDFSAFCLEIRDWIYNSIGFDILIARIDGVFAAPPKNEEEAKMMVNDIQELADTMSQHLSRHAYEATRFVKNTAKDTSTWVNKEKDKDVVLRRFTHLNLTDSETITLFLTCSYCYFLYGAIICAELKDDELEIIKDFLDAPDTLSVNNGIKRMIYIVSEGNLEIDKGIDLNRLLMTPSFKEVIRKKEIKELIGDFHSSPHTSNDTDDERKHEGDGKPVKQKEVKEMNPSAINHPVNDVGGQKTTTVFDLPDDYFKYKDQEIEPEKIIGTLKPEIIDAGPKVFAEIITALTYPYKKNNGATLNFLAPGKDNLQLVADILAGKKHDENKVVKWIEPVGVETEYVVLFLTYRLFKQGGGGKYERAYKLLLPNYASKKSSNYTSYGKGANANLRETIESIIKRSPRKPKQNTQ